MSAVVHIVGPGYQNGALVRQLCAWCGERIIDEDLRLVATIDGRGPSFWPEGELLEVDKERGRQTVIAHEKGAPLPRNACGAPPATLQVVR